MAELGNIKVSVSLDPEKSKTVLGGIEHIGSLLQEELKKLFDVKEKLLKYCAVPDEEITKFIDEFMNTPTENETGENVKSNDIIDVLFNTISRDINMIQKIDTIINRIAEQLMFLK